MRVSYLWRTALPTLFLVTAFVLLYEATVSDSRFAARQAELIEGTRLPTPGARLQFEATAYGKGTTTASGVAARTGIAAADPALLPVGLVIQMETDESKDNGVDRDGHRAGGPRPPRRHLHLELLRGSRLRPQAGPHRRAAPGLEPERQHAPHRVAVPPPDAAVAVLGAATRAGGTVIGGRRAPRR